MSFRRSDRIKGAGKELATERRIATVAQADALADAIGIRWRLMVYLGAYGPMRPEELAGLRRRNVDADNLVIRVRRAEPERTNGKRAPGRPSRTRVPGASYSRPSSTRS